MTIERFQHYYCQGSGIQIDSEEVECLVANLIYKVCSSPLGISIHPSDVDLSSHRVGSD